MPLIGYWGHPPLALLQRYRRELGQELVDLDVDMGHPETHVLPPTYCRIIRNIVDNVLALKGELSLIVASVGEEKCDQGRFAALVLRDMGFPVVETRNDKPARRREVTIATSDLPLREKVLRIMDTVHTPNVLRYRQCRPTVGYWGVPPHDLRLLDLFPSTTHVYGWTRCVEAGCPADLEEEMAADEGVPTVFFSQVFCAKQQLAKYLAEKHGGLYVDADGQITTSLAARVEAFIRFA